MRSQIQVSWASRAPPGILSPAQQTRDTLGGNRMLIHISKMGAVLRATPAICTPGSEVHVKNRFSTFLPTLGSSLHPEGPIAQAWGHRGHHIQAPRRPKQPPVGHPLGLRCVPKPVPPSGGPSLRKGEGQKEALAQRKRFAAGGSSKALSRTVAGQELGVGVGRKEDAFC